MDVAIARDLPAHLAPAALLDGEDNPVLYQRDMRLLNRSQLVETLEDQADRLHHLVVRSDLRPSDFVPGVSRGKS